MSCDNNASTQAPQHNSGKEHVPKRIKTSLWSYLSAFLVLAAALQGILDALTATNWFSTSALTVLAPIFLPALATVWLYISKENAAPQGRAYFGLLVATFAISLAVSYASQQALPAFGIISEPDPGAFDPLGLVFLIDAIVRAIALGLCYGYLARLLLAARTKPAS